MSTSKDRADFAAESRPVRGTATSDRWTRLVEALREVAGRWVEVSGVVAVRVRLDDRSSVLASCQVWAATPSTAWTSRADIDVAGMSMEALTQAVNAAGFHFPLTAEHRPKWRVDRNQGTTYTLDVMR
ncbi:hypothetical protein [Myceligenerans salitolerans]|uniref:Uncharacterized protein n=1 Tax=Myceligenerans salitolerans TaxID=1230528 RepID=A0ABS3I7H6_9MICO|nr:hypothetical protein [Myceligenerans salitolerans]MBO0608889.1 hypothetical protein [Myceligenerans salitolerans]